MIAEYEAEEPPRGLLLPPYLRPDPEPQAPAGSRLCAVWILRRCSAPFVDNYYQGLATTILLQNRLLPGKPTAENIWEALKAHYDGCALVSVAELGYDQPMIAANTMAGKDSLQLIVCGGEDRTTVTALFDNLGKGASGAAVQNMNLMLGFDEVAGLAL